MTLMEQIITIAICILCVQFTRLLPFWIFPANRPIPEYVRYLCKVLPAAMFGMLVVYCYKNVDVLSGYHGLPDFIALNIMLALKRKIYNPTFQSHILCSIDYISGKRTCFFLSRQAQFFICF